MRDVIGDVYGRLTVISDDGVIVKARKRKVTALCNCGEVRRYSLPDLLSGHTKSCGCLRREVTSKRVTTHGMKETRIYEAWTGMNKRCTASYQERFPTYTGVLRCPEWATFEGFLAHPPPGEFIDGVTVLGRIGDVGDYSPTNARWITKAENTREARLKYFIDGIPAVDIARGNGISIALMFQRIYLGWTLEDAATRPVRPLRRLKTRTTP